MVGSKEKHSVRIILSGLTACGKSTQAKQLAVLYGVPYVPMRSIMRAVSEGHGVFDAWALPWLYGKDDAVRVWIEADLASRVERCRVSFEMREAELPRDPASLINDKDEFARNQLRRLYGIELGPDSEVFDVIIENSKLMTSPTRQVAEADADLFSDVLFRESRAI